MVGSDKAFDAAKDVLGDLFEPVFEAYLKALSDEHDIGKEPDDKDDDDPPGDTTKAIPNPMFRDKETGRGVRIFHTAMNIAGAPSDLVGEFGVEPMKNLTQGNFLDGSKKIGLPDRTLPDKGRVQRAARSFQEDFVTVDIERWWPADHSGTKPLDDAALSNYERVSEWFDGAIPDGKYWAWYSTAPQRSYFPPVRGGSSLQRWKDANTRAAAILKLVDWIAPSLYTFASLPDQDDWDRYARGNVDEALRIGNDKPVLPFLWPFWHAKGTDPIARSFMRRQYNTCIDAGGSGFVIFITSGNRRTSFGSVHQEYFAAVNDLVGERLERIR